MAKKVDLNQSEIVSALRAAGASVQDLSQLGKGTPDLLIGFRDHNFLIEVKNPDGRCDLTDSEKCWIESWHGQVAICRTPEEALHILEATFENET